MLMRSSVSSILSYSTFNLLNKKSTCRAISLEIHFGNGNKGCTPDSTAGRPLLAHANKCMGLRRGRGGSSRLGPS